MPSNSAEDYVHRIGRTGRGETKGVAYSFVTLADARMGFFPAILDVVRRAGQTVPANLASVQPSSTGQSYRSSGASNGRFPRFGRPSMDGRGSHDDRSPRYDRSPRDDRSPRYDRSPRDDRMPSQSAPDNYGNSNRWERSSRDSFRSRHSSGDEDY